MEVKNCMLEKMTANFIKKMDFRDPIRKSKDENLKSWNYLETRVLRIIWKQEFGKSS